MDKSGSSYPPGCSGTPYDDCPDDSVCAACGSQLTGEAYWPENGFCDAACCLMLLVPRGRWPDDAPPFGGSVRKAVMKALKEIQAWTPVPTPTDTQDEQSHADT